MDHNSIKECMEFFGPIMLFLNFALACWTITITRKNSRLAEENTAIAKRNMQLAEQNSDLAKQNLKLAEDNRRNGLREHLFKEQLDFYKKFSEQVVGLGVTFDNIKFKAKSIAESEQTLVEQIEKLDRLLDINTLIVPTAEIYDSLAKISGEAARLNIALIEHDGKVDKENFEQFFNSFFKAIENIWEYYHIKELSAETKDIMHSRLRRQKT